MTVHCETNSKNINSVMCKDQLLSKGGTVSFDEICRSPEICQNL